VAVPRGDADHRRGRVCLRAHWQQRGLRLYRDLWFDRPQGIFVVYSAILRALGESTTAIRLGAAVYNACTTALVGALTARWWGDRAGLVAAAIYGTSSASPVLEGFTANGELFMAAPVLLSVMFAERRRGFLAGLSMALAVTIKPTALPAGLGAVTAIGARPRELRNLCAGLLVGLGISVVHGLSSDARTFLYAVAGFRLQAHSALALRTDLFDGLRWSLPGVIAGLLPVWCLAVSGAIARGGQGEMRGAAVARALVAGSAAGVTAGGSWYWHYYLGLLPGVAMLAGRGVVRRQPGRILLALTVVALWRNLRLIGRTPAETSRRVFERPAYLASRAIAEYIKARTTEVDTIYASFAQTDLYFLSGRRSAARQLYWTEINRVPGAFESLLQTLGDPAVRPKYIVEIDHDLEAPGRAAPFWALVQQHYYWETSIESFPLFRARHGAEAASSSAWPVRAASTLPVTSGRRRRPAVDRGATGMTTGRDADAHVL
jgi:hypothetical protein